MVSKTLSPFSKWLWVPCSNRTRSHAKFARTSTLPIGSSLQKSHSTARVRRTATGQIFDSIALRSATQPSMASENTVPPRGPCARRLGSRPR